MYCSGVRSSVTFSLRAGKHLAGKIDNNNVHLSCAHQRPERSHDTYQSTNQGKKRNIERKIETVVLYVSVEWDSSLK